VLLSNASSTLSAPTQRDSSAQQQRRFDSQPDTDAGELPGGATVAQIAAGDDFSLALTTGGQLYAFGDNEYGQLGNGTITRHRGQPTPSLVALRPAG